MAAQDPIKAPAVAFGRTLQLVFKSAALYSTDHQAVQTQLKSSFASLQKVLELCQEFTFGFAEGRVLINALLTTEPALAALQAEFRKRMVGAIVFNAGLPSENFRQALQLLAVPPKTITEAGGIAAYSKQRPVPGVRIVPAKAEADPDQDITLDRDSALGMAGGFGLERGGQALISLELLLDTAGLQFGTDLSRLEQLPVVMQTAVQNSLQDSTREPQKVLQALAEIIGGLGPDTVRGILSNHMNRIYDANLTAKELATAFVEDNTVVWATNQVVDANRDPNAVIPSEETVRVLLRGMQATQAAERMMNKLARLLEEHAVPSIVLERIRQELIFALLPLDEQAASLMQETRCSESGFRRLVALVVALRNQNEFAKAWEMANHYFNVVDASDLQAVEVERGGKLVEALPTIGVDSEWDALRRRLTSAFTRDGYADPHCHHSLAFLLVRVAQVAIVQGNLKTVQEIAELFEKAISADPPRHVDCCAAAVSVVLTAEVITTLLERYLQNCDDFGSPRVLAAILRNVGPRAVGTLLQRLEREDSAVFRLRLMRVIVQIGSSALQPVRAQLADPRWYVIRNACIMLGDLADPELLNGITPVLVHADERVQLIAFRVLQKVNSPLVARAIAAALPRFALPVLELAINELMLRRDPECLAGLEAFIIHSQLTQATYAAKAVQTAALVPDPRSIDLLGRLLTSPSVASTVRQKALQTLGNSNQEEARHLLRRFISERAGDPLIADCERLLTASNKRQSK